MVLAERAGTGAVGVAKSLVAVGLLLVQTTHEPERVLIRMEHGSVSWTQTNADEKSFRSLAVTAQWKSLRWP